MIIRSFLVQGQLFREYKCWLSVCSLPFDRVFNPIVKQLKSRRSRSDIIKTDKELTHLKYFPENG